MLETMEEKDFYKWLGSQFQTKREQKGFKQKEVAEKAEIAQGELSKFENKGKKLSAYRVLRLLKAIDCSMDELIGETEKKTYGYDQWGFYLQHDKRRKTRVHGEDQVLHQTDLLAGTH